MAFERKTLQWERKPLRIAPEEFIEAMEECADRWGRREEKEAKWARIKAQEAALKS